jgi:hypothetical protein
MRFWKTTLGTFAVTLAIWLLFTWPLPAHMGNAVPAGAHHTPAELQPMTPGDHLQFMYYCWLAGDWLTGQTPFFYNLYEFNTGDERACFHPDTYYIPFSLIFNLGAAAGGRAFGWNLTGFISLWLTYLFTLLLTRRYTTSEWIAWLTAVIGILVPYRWVNLFGGSPAGFAMMWTPAVLLGIDLAIRDGRWAGGVLAGVAIIGAAWGDQHVYFFSGLAALGWCVVAFSARETRPWFAWRHVGRCALVLLPFLLALAFALKFPKLMKLLTLHVTGQVPVDFSVAPRHWREVLNYSPEWTGFWGRSPLAISEQIYLGYTIFVVLVVGWFALLVRALRAERGQWQRWLALSLIGVGTLGVMYLALGYRAPHDAHWFDLARKWVPKYNLIRQPAKILCLLPTLFAVGATLTLGAVCAALRDRRWRIGLPLLVVATLVGEYCGRTYPVLTRLDNTQGAYAAVAASAREMGQPPHALVITLWPGDSHYASIYQHYASLYRVRMVDGYNPFIKKDYFENVFRRFESVNQGVISDEQFVQLNAMGVHWLLFHENLFPEKVSPFPASATLKNLLNHPRLQLLKQDGPVWAFRILDTPQPHPEVAADWTLFFPARQWEMERCRLSSAAAVQAAPDASGRACAALAYADAAAEIPAVRTALQPGLRWLVRARGTGELRCEQLVGTNACPAGSLTIDSTNWVWRSVSVQPFNGFDLLALRLQRVSGAVDLDLAQLVAGDWPALQPGAECSLPAAPFFHSGMTDLAQGAAVFRATHDAGGIVFYGPKLPFLPGTYEIELQGDSPAKTGTQLGLLDVAQNDVSLASVPIVAGQHTRFRLVVLNSLPLHLAFVYSAAADVTIHRVIFKRVQ